MDQRIRPSRDRRSLRALAPSVFLFLALCPWPSPAGTTGDIRVKVVGLQSDRGEVRFGLYNRKEGFATKEAVVAKGAHPIKNGQCEFVIKAVPHGMYAVIVGHDVNKDGKIDQNITTTSVHVPSIAKLPSPRDEPTGRDARLNRCDPTREEHA